MTVEKVCSEAGITIWQFRRWRKMRAISDPEGPRCAPNWGERHVAEARRIKKALTDDNKRLTDFAQA